MEEKEEEEEEEEEILLPVLNLISADCLDSDARSGRPRYYRRQRKITLLLQQKEIGYLAYDIGRNSVGGVVGACQLFNSNKSFTFPGN